MPPARISMNKMRGPKIRSVEQSEEAEAGRGGKCRFKTPRGSSRGLTCRLRSPPSFSRSCSCCSKDCTFFSSGLIFPAVPSATGRIRPALHARRSRGGFDGQLLSCAKRLAVPCLLLELGHTQMACICPILTATGALATAGSELSFVAHNADWFARIVHVAVPLTRLLGFALGADQRDALFYPSFGIDDLRRLTAWNKCLASSFAFRRYRLVARCHRPTPGRSRVAKSTPVPSCLVDPDGLLGVPKRVRFDTT